MKIILMILYGQLNLYCANEPAFLLWNDNHVAQGFAWRQGTVSFGVPDYDGETYVEIKQVDDFPPIEDDVLRVIQVPFKCNSKVMLATVSEAYETDIEAGTYRVEYRLSAADKASHIDKKYDHIIQLFFKKSYDDEFLIIKKSGDMTSDKVLTKEALAIVGNHITD